MSTRTRSRCVRHKAGRGVAGIRVHRAGADGTERRCVRSAATLEGTGVVMTVITVATVKKSAAKKTAPATAQAATESGGQ